MTESPRGEDRSTSAPERAPDKPDTLWPRLIIGGALFVVFVNFAYIWVAVSGADEVVPSYVEEER